MSTITLFPRRTWPSRLGYAAAALALAAIVLGVPIALSLGGSPFPAHGPDLSAAWRDLRAGYVPTIVLANVALLAGWCVWAFLTFEIVTEARSVLRTHTSRRSAALGPLQPLVAKLVAAAVLSLPLATVRPVLRPAVASAVVLSAARPTTQTAAAPAPSNAAGEQVALPTYTVRRGDTLWGIAERYLGNPLRWQEIAKLNADRPEKSGEFTDPHWIFPGWTLLLPADAKGLPASNASTATTTTPRSESGPRRTMAPETAPQQRAAGPQDGAAGRKPSATDRSAGGASAAATHLLAPTAEPRAAVRQGSAPMTASPMPPNGPITRRPGDTGGNAASSGARSPAPARVPVGPIGGTLLAAGLLGLLANLRRVQMRHRRSGRRIAMPTGSVAEVERGLGAAAHRTEADLVDRATRLLGIALANTPTVPDVLGAVVSEHAVDFLLAVPQSAPAPFVNATAASWRLDRHHPSVELALITAEGSISVLPALVSIGEDEDGLVMVNLEAGGLTAIRGDTRVAGEVATAVALELASASWVECLELIDVGVGTGNANPHYCTTLSRLSEAFTMINERHSDLERGLAERGYACSGAARLCEPTERWSPLAVVAAEPLDDAEREELASIDAPERYGLAILIAEPLEQAHWQLVAHEDGTIELPMLGRRVRAQRISRGHLAGIAALLGLAASRADVASDAPPYDTTGPNAAATRARAASVDGAPVVNDGEPFPGGPAAADEDADEALMDSGELAADEHDDGDPLAEASKVAMVDDDVAALPLRPTAVEVPNDGEVAPATDVALDEVKPEPIEPEPLTLEVPVLFDKSALLEERDEERASFEVPKAKIEVGLLGPLVFSGLAVEPERGKASELIVWLALHPNGASNDTMMTALWPKGISSRTAWNARWDARRALGKNDAGEDRMDDELVLSTEVSTDWARFRTLVASGRLAAKREALALVRGRPFERFEWQWVTMDGFLASATGEVADVAVSVGEEELARGDFDAAIAAAESGLVADPYDERLFRIVMRANDGLGNPGGVRAAMQKLESLVEDDVEPFESVHPETRALYNELRSRRVPPERGGGDPGGVIRRIH